MSLHRRWHEPPDAPRYFEGSYDCTGPVSFLAVAAEMRSRWSARTAREARRQGSWLRLVASRLGDILRRGDRAPAGGSGADPDGCSRCRGGGLCASCVFELEDAIEGRLLKDLGPEGVSGDELVRARLEALDSTQALMLARTIAERDGNGPLKDALHYLIILDVADAVRGLLPLLARPANEITQGLAAPEKEIN